MQSILDSSLTGEEFTNFECASDNSESSVDSKTLELALKKIGVKRNKVPATASPEPRSSESDTDTDTADAATYTHQIKHLRTKTFRNDFINYAKSDMQSFLEKFTDATKSKVITRGKKLSERMKALITLDRRVYKNLAEKELYDKLRTTFGNSTRRIISDYSSLSVETVAKDDDCVIGLKCELKYDIKRRFGHTRADIVEHFLLPEHLTEFIMNKYSLSYEEATGKLYSIDRPANTVFFDALNRQ